MSLRTLCATLVALTVLFAAARAEQFSATGGIYDGTTYGTRYAGPGGTSGMATVPLGMVVDGGRGAFDAFGFYNGGVGTLTQSRQVELLSGNVFRFLDTFTNGTAAAVTTTLTFFGNLGSDGDELVSTSQPGLVVSCQDDGTGTCTSEPVLALVSGNNGLAQAAVTPDRYNARFAVSLLPGQSLSLLNFAFLASDAAGTTAADVDLARTTGLALLDAPRLDGLTAAQLGTIANFQTVPEPASLAILAGAVAIAGLGRRVRRRG